MAHAPEMLDVDDAVADPTVAAQIERERSMLAEGVAQLDRGECYDWAIVKAWMRALEVGSEATLPPVVQRF